MNVRGISAVGSAPHWQCGGHGFKSRILHLSKVVKKDARFGENVRPFLSLFLPSPNHNELFFPGALIHALGLDHKSLSLIKAYCAYILLIDA